MAITNSDILDGKITFREKTYAIAEFTLKEGVSVDADELIQITGNYRSNGSTSNITIFNGRIENYNLRKHKEIIAFDKGKEVEDAIPYGYYAGWTGEAISLILDDYANYIYANYGPYTATGHYRARYNFLDQVGRTGTEINFINEQSNNISTSIIDKTDVNSHYHKSCLKLDGLTGPTYQYIKHNFSPQEFGTKEFWFLCEDCTYQVRLLLGNSVFIYIDNDKLYYKHGETSYELCSVNDNTFYRYRIDFECGNGGYKGLFPNCFNLYIYEANGTPKAQVTGRFFYVSAETLDYFKIFGYENGTNICYLDAVDESWSPKHFIGRNANEITFKLPQGSSEIRTIEAAGSQSLENQLDYGSKLEEITWALKPTGEIRWHAMTENLGITLDGSEEYSNVSGEVQVTRINRVVVKGPLGLQGEANNYSLQATHGIISYNDYTAQSLSVDELNEIAQAILNKKSTELPLRVRMTLRLPTYGYLQVGEYLTINVNSILFTDDSGEYVPAGTYRVVECQYIVGANAEFQHNNLILEDGLSFEKKVKIEEENSQAAAIASGATIVTGTGSGESNTGQNVGVGGIGIFKQKDGVVLQLKNINAKSSKVSITDDPTNDEVDIDVESANIKHSEINNDQTTGNPHEVSLEQARTKSNVLAGSINFNNAGKILNLQAGTADGESVRYNEFNAHKISYTNPHQVSLEQARTKNNQLSGSIDMNQNQIQDLPAPSSDTDAARKSYVLERILDVNYGVNWDNKLDQAPSADKCYEKFVSVDDNIEGLQACLIYKGVWDASSGSYPASPEVGDYWIVTTAGTTSGIFYSVFDWIVWNGTIWNKITRYEADVTIKITTNDSIQAAVTKVLTAGGGVVVFDVGIHGDEDTFPITIDNANYPLIIKGQGPTTIINTNGNNTVFSITNCKQFILENLKIDASDMTTEKNLINIHELNNNPIIIDKVSIIGHSTNKKGTGIEIFSNNITIHSCDIQNLLAGIYSNLTYSQATDIFIMENRIKNIATYGIHVRQSDRSIIANNSVETALIGISVKSSKYVVCEGNTLTNILDFGIECADYGDARVEYCTVNGNMIYDCSVGIILSESVLYAGHCIVSDNTIYCSKSELGELNDGIKIGQITDCVISGNSINGAVNNGIELINSDRILISGNLISNSGDYGINIDSNSANNIIGIQLFYNNTDGNILNNGTETIIHGDNIAYGASWDGNLGTATKNAVYDELNNNRYTKTEVNTNLGIGIANKQWINLALSNVNPPTKVQGTTSWANVDGTDFTLTFDIPLPYIKGTHNLVITRMKIGLNDADANDFVSSVLGYGWINYYSTSSDLIADYADKNSAGDFIIDFADITIGGVYIRFCILVDCIVTTANELDIGYVLVEYYYT